MTPVDEMREMAVVFDAEDYPDLARRLCGIAHEFERMERELARLKQDDAKGSFW